MELTAEMKEMMERTMEQYFAAYWEKHATPEQEAKRAAEGKTFKGAYEFCRSVAEKNKGKAGDSRCVAMPDDLAYWILMHYMENEKEGATYKTAEEVEQERKKELEKAQKKQKELEDKAAKMNDGSLIQVSPEDIEKAEAEAKIAKEQAKAIKASISEEKAKAEAVAEKVEQEQLSLF